MAKKSTGWGEADKSQNVAIQLQVLSAGLDPPPSIVIHARRASLGRAEHCDVRIPDPSVSQLHASLVKRGDHYLLIDEGSHYGTGVGPGPEPIWLAPDAPRILSDGEHVWLGQIELCVRMVHEKGRKTDRDQLPLALVRAGLLSVGIEPSDERIASTLAELTELPDEEVPLPLAVNPPKLGVADLFDEDKHPPWKADLFVASLALLITAGCTLFYFHLQP